MIPKSFKLVNRTLSVERMKDDVASAGSMHGDFNIKRGRIRVANTGFQEYDEHIFFHELAHAILESSPKPKLSKDEKFVDALGGLLHQFMQTQKGEL